MAINLEREGVALNAAERNKRNANLTKIEDAINEVGAAVPAAEAAKLLSEEAKAQAIQAEEKAAGVETQLNEIVVNGDSSVEAAQARVRSDGTVAATLKERLDGEHQEVAVKLAETDGRIDHVIATAGDGTIPSELSDMRLINGKNYTTAGEALRAIARSEAITGLDPNNFKREYQVPTINLFNVKDSVIERQWINAEGVFSTTSSYNILSADVVAGQTITWYRTSGTSLTSLTGRYVIRDASGNNISSGDTASPVTIPAGGVKMYKNIPRSTFAESSIMAVAGATVPPVFVPFGAKALKDSLVDLSGVYSRIAALEETSGGDAPEPDTAILPYDHESRIPAYWKPYLEQKVDEIKNRQSALGRNGYTFIQMADFHLNTSMLNSPSLLKFIADNCDVRYIVNTGDYANRVSRDPKGLLLNNMPIINKLFEGTWSKTLPSQGNHDVFWGDDGLRKSLTQAEIYAHYFLPFVSRNDNIVYAESGNYYYCDDPHGKIRFINLNCFDAPNEDLNPDGTPVYNSGNTFAFSERQIDWVYNEALNTPEGYAVVLFSHVTPRNVAGTITPEGGALLTKILEAYKNGASITDSHVNTEDANFNISEKTYDFTGRGGEIIMYTSGHFHKDRHRVWNGIYMQTITLDSIDAHQGEPGYEDVDFKTPGTTTEHAFDVVTVDRDSGNVYTTRIGAGSDKQFNYKNPQ